MFRSLLKNNVLALWLITALLSVSSTSYALEELCAVVQIEIVQELALERQAFEAKMKITNSLDTLSLDNVEITINFKDDQGRPIEATSDPSNQTAAFFIRVDDLFNVDDIAGNGTIEPTSIAEIRWLIIPSANAAQGQPEGNLYFVGASLSYTFGGEFQAIEVAPDTIVVKPQPLLTLDYFLTQEVFGDDAFTAEIEPPVPYTLGVRIANNGAGIANNVTIDSAQPRIVENEQGVDIGFEITGSFLNDQAADKSLLIDFGDIEPDGITNGRWNMETTLSGEFTAFTASFSHADELGGQLTSLLEATNAHFLIRDVKVDVTGRDSIKDFLSLDNDLVLRVYESEPLGIDTPQCRDCSDVSDQSSGSSLGVEQNSGSAIQRTVTTLPQAGFVYIKLSDPYAGTKVIARAERSDGKVLTNDNVWFSKSRADDNQTFDYFINIFDVNNTPSYSLTFSDIILGEEPPALAFISDKTTYEGSQVGFLVRASDPNGTVPALSASDLPSGASFTDEGGGQGVFSWFPGLGQAGTYDVTFTASDGELVANQIVTIIVNTGSDRDGDGLPDDWELENFGNLDKDGAVDSDSDGLLDSEEFEIGTDPNNPDTDGDDKNDSVDDIPLFNASWLNSVLILMLD
jgi:hypothetical protein